ncbi:MarR family transcriptional regulator [Streptomyces sp. NPDC047000]|uniref:MarR family winged helix-turn-helix transcriptional regulator n=1 Tax=Streptomyces sp. NPDC047000 TaxID=3155474 RepID=UPI00340B0BD2
MSVTKPFRPRPEPGEAAGVTAMAAELLEVLWGRADIAPVSSSQLRVLLALDAHEDINLRTLADHLGSTPPSTSRLCDRLQAAGFVEREVCETDRREVRLRLSPQGRTFLTDLRTRREAALSTVLDHMPPTARHALLTGLRSFCEAATTQLTAGPPAAEHRTA